MAFLILLPVVMGALGGWVAAHKRRDRIEGIILGVLFGPFGVLIEALLPTGRAQPNLFNGQPVLSLDDQGLVAYIASRYQDEIEGKPNLAPHRRRQILKPIDKVLQKELKLSPTRYADYAALARRSVFGETSKLR